MRFITKGIPESMNTPPWSDARWQTNVPTTGSSVLPEESLRQVRASIA